MQKESLAKIIGLACLGLMVFPYFWAKDVWKGLKRQPSPHEIIFAMSALKKVK